MRRTFIVILLLPACGALRAQIPFPDLRTGDLLFQMGGRSSYNDAIRSATTSRDGVEYTHVGVALVEEGAVFVLEAVPFGVTKTPLTGFFRQSAIIGGNPAVAAGRLKCRYRRSIAPAIDRIVALLGKRYDFVFDPSGDEYYCSELVYATFLRRCGKPIFEARPMTFKDKATGELSLLWEAHFQRYKHPVTEGAPGTNPGDMSRSKAIHIIHKYF